MSFREDLAAGYAWDEASVVLGVPLKDGALEPSVRVRIPLSRINRHGLIAGATGTGKTKTLQVLAGQLSDHGVPVFAVDVKGDLTGVGAPADPEDARVLERARQLAWEHQPMGHPIELLSLSGAAGAQVRATVSSFGPLLLGKVLDLNETQTSVLSLVFAYADDNDLPLLDLADLRTTLRFLASDDGKPVLEAYGGMSSASVGVILRALVTLEQDGADAFFGEPEFDPEDLIRTTPEGRGVISLLEVADVMARPRLYATFVLWLLAELFEALPEAGDLPRPKLAFFFDEAHLLFADASDALMEQIERTARLIRSKGVGVYFVTQAPTDVPSSVLSQLGHRVQHALRAFTPEDADALRKTARTFPVTEHYDVERTLTSLGIGEALVTVLGPAGTPTPLAAVRLVPPDSRMAPLAADELEARRTGSALATKYGAAIDRESAHELITARLAASKAAAAAATAATAPGTRAPASRAPTQRELDAEIRRRARELEQERKARERERRAAEREARTAERQRQRTLETGIRTAGRVVTSRAGQDLIRGVFGVLFGRKR